ncbi:hypothetical protein JW935_25035, partial [candidate division KSB1 bacterium]|nr:hypothetical protein [candidate division KSB1 bacterium]
MNVFRKIRIPAFVFLVGSVTLATAVDFDIENRSHPSFITRPASAEKVPNADGFIQRWLILEPIPASGLTDSAVQAA